MGGAEKPRELLRLRFAITRATGYLLAAATLLHVAGRAEAELNVAVDCSGGFPCELIPILDPDQVLLAAPAPDIIPDNPCLTCPPFIEIFDIPELDPGEVEPPPPFEARVRLYGGPQPEPPTDNPNLPNLLLIFAGPNDISGPMEFAPFSLPLPPATTELSYYAQAFDALGNVVSNTGVISIPEPMGPVAVDTDLSDVTNAIISHVFTATGGAAPYLWSNLQSTAGSPSVAPTLMPEGIFQWHTIGSARPGRYVFEATVTDNAGQTDVGSLTLNLIVPEPSAAMLILTVGALAGGRFTRRTSRRLTTAACFRA